MTSGLTEAQKVKLGQRLALRPDRGERGSLLPQTAKALAMPVGDTLAQAERAAALALALVTERLIVPVPVETHADPNTSHAPFTGEAGFPLPTVPLAVGSAVLAFTSAAELGAWQESARPTPLPAQQVAVAATQFGAPPAILVDAASSTPVVLPVGAVHALVGGDSWLPPWRDEALTEEILRLASRRGGRIVSVKVVPHAEGESYWQGALEVQLRCQLPSRGQRGAEEAARTLAGTVAAIGELPRLRRAAPKVVLTPIPVSLA